MITMMMTTAVITTPMALVEERTPETAKDKHDNKTIIRNSIGQICY